MNTATRTFTSTFGAIMALAGIEHGIGEVLQGNIAPAGIMIQSWPDSAFFRSLNGEPAMTVIPNLLVTGILAILVSLILLAWATLFVQRKNGGLVMILLSIAMLLVGGGIFPPILGIIIGMVGTRINTPLTRRRTHLSTGSQKFLGKLWSGSFILCMITWPTLLLGVPILSNFFGVNDTVLILTLILTAIGTLLLTIFTGFSYDTRMQMSKS